MRKKQALHQGINDLAIGCVRQLLAMGLPEAQAYRARDMVAAYIKNFEARLVEGEWEIPIAMLQYETSPEFRAIANAAVRAQSSTGFPARVMLAVWACESQWGQRVTGSFNYWGITRAPEEGPARFCPTHEELTAAQFDLFRPDERATAIRIAALGGGKFRYSMSRWFASYASREESVVAYTEFFTKSPHRYQAAWRQYLVDRDEDALLRHICEAGYATGNAETVEISIEHQANIAHAVEQAMVANAVSV